MKVEIEPNMVLISSRRHSIAFYIHTDKKHWDMYEWLFFGRYGWYGF